MNDRTAAALGRIALVATLLAASALAAQRPPVERVLVKDGKLLAQAGGITRELDKDLALPNDIVVSTNGTFRVKAGKERKLLEGQQLGADGMLISPDGSIVSVLDHVLVRNGRPLITLDGDTTAPSGDVLLADGSRITADAYHLRPGGRVKLLDGQMLKLDGQPIPVKDSITLDGGRVRVQKDGSQFHVLPGRSLIMNDGTRVFGNGTVVGPDGKTRKLSEGEILTVEGVIRK